MIGRANILVTHDETDVILMSYLVKAVARETCINNLLCDDSDDSDVFVLTVYWM